MTKEEKTKLAKAAKQILSDDKYKLFQIQLLAPLKDDCFDLFASVLKTVKLLDNEETVDKVISQFKGINEMSLTEENKYKLTLISLLSENGDKLLEAIISEELENEELTDNKNQIIEKIKERSNFMGNGLTYEEAGKYSHDDLLYLYSDVRNYTQLFLSKSGATMGASSENELVIYKELENTSNNLTIIFFIKDGEYIRMIGKKGLGDMHVINNKGTFEEVRLHQIHTSPIHHRYCIENGGCERARVIVNLANKIDVLTKENEELLNEVLEELAELSKTNDGICVAEEQLNKKYKELRRY